MAYRYKRKFLIIPSLPPVPREDWTGMLKYLVKSGVPKNRISKHTGMSKELIYTLLDGRPGKLFYMQGLRLKQVVDYVKRITPEQLSLEINDETSKVREGAVADDASS